MKRQGLTTNPGGKSLTDLIHHLGHQNHQDCRELEASERKRERIENQRLENRRSKADIKTGYGRQTQI